MDRHPPDLPANPNKPSTSPSEHNIYILEKYEMLSAALELKRASFRKLMEDDLKKVAAIKRGIAVKDPDALSKLIELTISSHALPEPLNRPAKVCVDFGRRIILCDIDIPDLSKVPILRKRGETLRSNWLPVSKAHRRKAIEDVISSLCIRAAYLAAMSDVGQDFETIAVNATQSWTDHATGTPRKGVIASLQSTKAELLQLQLSKVEPKSCFRHLKGLITPSVDQVKPIRPIFVFDTTDERVTRNRDVADQLDQEANLAAMPWEDFEQLVRQLFEWEFGRNGVEVKVTRASRDRGVDAIMFDPDPLRGGKYVLQAKRYTRLVDVAAVRDLYGTLVNEGANRGILVTTSAYGPDSYEFAKNKPISLVDGPNLIAMLRRHGRGFRIDLAEARRLEDENKGF